MITKTPEKGNKQVGPTPLTPSGGALLTVGQRRKSQTKHGYITEQSSAFGEAVAAGI